jgi:small subunit ribosomal protein S9
MPKQTSFEATGRRKTSVARVRMLPGTGNIVINQKAFETYFGRSALQMIVQQPFKVTGTVGKFDIMANICGGGIAGQADALKHGIARVLLEMNPDYRKPLKKAGFLTRDPRIKERKKYGHKKARKRFQYSKR